MPEELMRLNFHFILQKLHNYIIASYSGVVVQKDMVNREKRPALANWISYRLPVVCKQHTLCLLSMINRIVATG